MEHSADITSQLIALRGGESAAMERLFPLVYEELHRIAHRQMGRERGDHTLDTTGLVHEAYLKLVDQTRAQWSDRAHFFAVASNAMRRILVDYARRYHTDKRGAAPRRHKRPRASLDGPGSRVPRPPLRTARAAGPFPAAPRSLPPGVPPAARG